MLSSPHSAQQRQFPTTPQRTTSFPRWRAPVEEEGNWWSITFSDLVLILLCFVVLWHMAEKQRQPEAVLSQEPAATQRVATSEEPEVTIQFNAEPDPDPEAPSLQSQKQTESPVAVATASSLGSSSGPYAASTTTEWQELHNELRQYIAEQGLDQTVGVIFTEQGLVISLSDTITFPSGQATLNEAVTPLLSRVAALASERATLDIEIAGHTDDRPIATPEFPSNWELSAARASRVARLLLEQERIDPIRVSTRGYAHFRPLYVNDTEEHRAANRRVEIRFFRRVEPSGGRDYEW